MSFFLLHCYVVAMKPLMVVLDGRLLKDLTFEILTSLAGVDMWLPGCY